MRFEVRARCYQKPARVQYLTVADLVSVERQMRQKRAGANVIWRRVPLPGGGSRKKMVVILSGGGTGEQVQAATGLATRIPSHSKESGKEARKDSADDVTPSDQDAMKASLEKLADSEEGVFQAYKAKHNADGIQ